MYPVGKGMILMEKIIPLPLGRKKNFNFLQLYTLIIYHYVNIEISDK
jgi:hypothetical protein